MTVIAPSELYQDPSVKERFEDYNWLRRLPLEAMLVSLDEVVEHPDMVDYLDSLQDTDRDAWYNAKTVITHLPPQAIYDNYGEKTLAWAAANATTLDLAGELKDALADLAGYDKDLFEKARLWCWQKMSMSSKGSDVLAQYAVMDSLMNGALEKVDLTRLLKDSAKPGVELSEKRIADYALIPLRAKEASSRPDGRAKDWDREVEAGIYVGIWLDAPTGFALTYKGRPNALVAVAASSPDGLMIHQLQGVQALKVDSNKKYSKDYVIGSISSRGLAPLDWQKLLVQISEKVANGMGMTQLGIQGGDNNKWTKITCKGETSPHLSKEAAIKAYDVPAERLGLIRGEDGNWHLPLGSTTNR